MNQQLSEVTQGLLLEDFQTGQTGSVFTGRMVGANKDVNLAAVALQIVRRNGEMNRVLDEGGWGELEAYGNSIVQRYKERNGADLVTPKPGMSEEEMTKLSLQFDPVEVDPNEIAEFRQRLAQLDAQLQPLGTSVFTDPRTKRIATMLNVDAELGRPGMIQSTEQNLNDQLDPFTKYVGLPLTEAVDEFVGGAAQLGVGIRSVLHDLGVVSLNGLTEGNADAYYNGPTSWVQDQDGTWYHNGGKVGATEVYAGVWYGLTGELIEQQMAEYANTKATAVMQAAGIQGLAVGVGQFMGAMGAFLGTGGPAMKAGSMLTKGLGIMATGGKAAKSLSRTEKMVKLLAERSGPAAALGAVEAVKSGRIEGYGKAFLHGTVMAVPMMVMGSLGDRLERTLSRYKHLPKPMARTLAGTVEGVGLDLGTWEAGWQFVADPTKENLKNLTQQVFVNSIGNAILRGTGVTAAHEYSMPADQQAQRTAARRGEAQAAPEVAAAKRGTSLESAEQLGVAARDMKTAVGVAPEVAVEARGRVKEAEQKLDVEEAGVALTESEKLEGRHSLREEIAKVKAEPNSPERQRKIIDLLNRSRLAFGKTFATEVKKIAEMEEAKAIEEKKTADEILGGSDLVKALLGDKVASDYHAERQKRLKEKGIEMTDLAVELGKGVKGKEPEGEDAEVEAMAKKLGIPINEMREQMGMPPIAETGKETNAPADDTVARYSEEMRAKYRGADEPEIVEARAPTAPRAGEPASIRMKPSLEQEGVPDTKPIRASDVLKEMGGFEGDPVQVPIRKGVGVRGRMSTKGILGWYNLHERVVRLGGARDIVTAAHEWSHAMDMRVNFREPLSEAEAKGLMASAEKYYPGFAELPAKSQRMEAWAEFWARHMLDDPTLPAETGPFHDRMMKWIADPKQAGVKAQMDRIQAGLRRYRDQGAVQRVRQSVVLESDQKSVQELKAEGVMKDTPPARALGFVRRAWNVFMKTMVDDVHDLKQSQERWLRIAGVEASRDITSNPTRLYDALRMTASKQAEAFLVHGTHDMAGNRTGEGLADIFREIGAERYEDFISYLVAKRSIEIQDKGHPTQLAREDYLTAVEKLESPEFINGAKRIRAWSDRLINYAVDGGLFSAKQADAIKGSYETYIPFQRVLEGPEQHAPGRGVAERGTGVRSLRGGSEEIRDPVNALGDMARNIITKTQQAMVMKAMVKFGIVHEGVGGFVTEVKRGVIPKDHPMMEIADALRRANREESAIRRAEGDTGKAPAEDLADIIEKLVENKGIGPSITLFGQQTIPKGSRPIIAYTPHFSEAELARMTPKQQRMAKSKNDKLLWLEVDVPAYDALMGLDAPQSILDKMPEFLRNVLEKPAKLVRFGATVASPGFAVRNVIRDAVSDVVYTSDRNRAWFLSGFGRFAKGLVEGGSESAEIFDALGGGVSTFFAGEVAAGRTAREMLQLNRNWVGKAMAAVHGYTDRLSKWTEQPLRTEAFGRARAAALAEGRSELDANLEALEAAKEITINFTRGGTITRALNRLVPYLNAGVQGNRKFFMTLAGKNGDVAQRSAWMRAATSLVVPTIALWWLNKDEEWYQELPEWRRLNYWNMKIPGTDEIVSVPKPFEIGKLFGSLPEAMLDEAMGQNPVGVGETALDAVTSLVPQWPIPAVLKPFVEIASNYDFFTRRQIVPEWLEGSRAPKDQLTAYTRYIGRAGAGVARAMGFDPSPMVVEHFVDSMTGGMAGRLEDSLATAGGATSALKGEGLRDVPVVGTLFRQREFEQSRSVQEIFDLEKSFAQKAGSGELTGREKNHRTMVNRAKDRIAKLKADARDGRLARSDADKRAASIARETLQRIHQ